MTVKVEKLDLARRFTSQAYPPPPPPPPLFSPLNLPQGACMMLGLGVPFEIRGVCVWGGGGGGG